MKKSLFLIFVICIFNCESKTTNERTNLNHTIDSLKVELLNANNIINSLKGEANKIIEPKYNNENFDSFFWSFMTDSTFQMNRIKFPLTYITWKDDLGGPIDTLSFPKNKWKYNSFYINTASERTQIYDNFDLILRPTNERVIHWYGVETGGDSKYYFEGKNGKWYLVQKEQLGD
ncbi:DUF4348 domain-containing protein [Winogradskyella helgolandensis]|uniref:DUF4348 domain-containing protein n=1 Tax=Winogradskyella helgolandensis TaxID=2697010 RepID=UPI0015BFAB6A|nr:DUF4348 domain-containing protein [Winogradskyella helgolandensis]